MGCKNCNKGKFERILEGWRYVLWPDPRIEKIAKERARKCLACDESGVVIGIDICKLCSCPLTAKCRSLSEECDLGEWGQEKIITHV